MDHFSASSFLDHSFYLSLRELILLLIVFYQLGYYFGKKTFFSVHSAKTTPNSLPVLYLPCS